MPKTSQETANKSYVTETEIFKAYPNKHELTKAEFMFISSTFFYALSKSIIDEGKVYYLPPKMGTIGVYKTKTKGKMINYQHYKETGEKIKMQNLHSNGLMAMFYWNTHYTRFKLSSLDKQSLYVFKAPRAHTRYLSKQIKEKNTITKYYDY
jgi:hypothetical protein